MSVIVPGSYDPVTLGHLDIIRRAAEKYGARTGGFFLPQRIGNGHSGRYRKDTVFADDERCARIGERFDCLAKKGVLRFGKGQDFTVIGRIFHDRFKIS